MVGVPVGSAPPPSRPPSLQGLLPRQQTDASPHSEPAGVLRLPLQMRALDSSPWKGTHCPPRLWGQGGEGRGPGSGGLSSPSFTATSEIRRGPGICSKSSHPAAHFIDSALATAPLCSSRPLSLWSQTPTTGVSGCSCPLPASGPTLSLQASGRAGVWRGLYDSAAAESPGLSVN